MTGLIDYKNWMGSLLDVFGERRPWEIILPGTHNSGAFSADYYTGARNQSLDIKTQLEAGVRSLDIRIQKDGDYFYMQHSGYTAASQSYEIALDQIAAFIESNTQEVLQIRLSGQGASPSLTSDDVKEALKLTDDKIGSYCEPYSQARFNTGYYSLNNMVTRNRRIILISDIWAPGSSLRFWYGRNGWPIKSSWKSYQSNGGTPPSLSVPWMIEYVSSLLLIRNTENGDFQPPFLDANLVIWYCSPWIGKDYVNQHVPGWITQWIAADLGKTINIISLDYIAPAGQDAAVTSMIVSNQAIYGEQNPIDITDTAAPLATVDQDKNKQTEKEEPNSENTLDQTILRNARMLIKENGFIWENLLKEFTANGCLESASISAIAEKLKVKNKVVEDFVEWYQQK